ncbi:MAG: GntR family transcriptional regulator [Lautropia sp.]
MTNASGAADRADASERQPLQERAVGELREAIVRGRIRPGERLSEPDLAQRFGISRSPIREALVQLEIEGFVERAPTGRVFVRPLDLEEARQLFVVRANLEGLAIRLAAENMSRRDTRRLEANLAAMDAASARGRISEALMLGAEFHQTIIDACGNRPLRESLSGFRARTSRYRHILASQEALSDHRIDEHRRILRALLVPDADEAERAMIDHIEASSRATLEALRAYGEATGALRWGLAAG